MNLQTESEAFWAHIIEEGIAAGGEANRVPILSFSYKSALSIASKLNLRLKLERGCYVFIQEGDMTTF